MTIALLRLYKKAKRTIKQKKKIYHFVNLKISGFSRFTLLGKNPVTIDDYRATAFVPHYLAKRNRQREEPYHFVNLSCKGGKQSILGRELFAPPGPFSRPQNGGK